MRRTFPVVDLFAGPGGLGEGFASYTDAEGNQPFKVALSIEKDDFAHRTLELRAFYREFNRHTVPDDYYAYLRGEISSDHLFNNHHKEYYRARKVAWNA